MPSVSEERVLIIGAGPAGLMAAYDLALHGIKSIVFEKSHVVGGIARTEQYRGFHFDMGGHRFFTKSTEVRQRWVEILGEEFLRRPRLSRIYFKKRFFNYPLKPWNTLWGLGPFESMLILASYVRWRLFPHRPENTFEEWVVNRFGRRLFRLFFKAYTEKVWGIPCSELSAEWAAQRIKDLSLKAAVVSMFVKPRKTVTTLIEEFDYPRRGPGMMWNAARQRIEGEGGSVRLNSDVLEIRRESARIQSVLVNRDGQQEVVEGSDFISSMPITEFIKKLHPPPPPNVLEAAGKLRYRDFLTVCLVVNHPDLFPDNWIYIHDPKVKVGRIQNFKNWSPDMVPDQTKTSLGLEYFCTEGDELWRAPDADLIELGKRELERLGLARMLDVEDGCVFRVARSYPMYDGTYREHLAVVKDFVNGLENFQTIGRNGLHRYNNQDHAMLTGMLAVRNLVLGERNDLWNVNTEQAYHEEIDAAEEEIRESVQAALAEAFRKFDPVALGASIGTVAGALLMAATLFLVAMGGPTVSPHLELLNQYFPAYSITAPGSLVGLAYGFLTGFAGGWSFAFVRNAAVLLFAGSAQRRIECDLLQKLLLSI